jgi:hypothetical protein
MGPSGRDGDEMGRSGELHVTKECPEYKGRAGDFCTIASSNVDEIGDGSRVVYATAAGDGSLDSDVSLECGSGNTATGHVVLDLGAGSGRITFSGGTGAFANFSASADVSADAAGTWHWDGDFSFTAEPAAVSS